MNSRALTLPIDKLWNTCMKRRAERVAESEARDLAAGRQRIRITSYMENIGWPPLFGYAMSRYLNEADFSVEYSLRQMLFWLDNVADDTLPAPSIQADVGWYWDMTLFGQEIRHTDDGVPQFLPHPFQTASTVPMPPPFSFTSTGEMPALLTKYARMTELSKALTGGSLGITLPSFHRGPLDIYVQLRGYERFLGDVADQPDELRAALLALADARLAFARERRDFLGESALPPASFVADDWVNIPFISPAIFRSLVVPVYARIEANEGPVTGFHTCGRFEAVAGDLLRVFPAIRSLDISGWNDLDMLDACLDPRIAFNVQIINTVSLGRDEAAQRTVIERIKAVGQHRPVSICAQAIVKLCPTYEETLARLDRFLSRACAWLS